MWETSGKNLNKLICSFGRQAAVICAYEWPTDMAVLFVCNYRPRVLTCGLCRLCVSLKGRITFWCRSGVVSRQSLLGMQVVRFDIHKMGFSATDSIGQWKVQVSFMHLLSEP